jgi:hypothetical protein
MKKQSKLAFSLIELSIVILVIGILVIGITQGSRVIKEAKLKSAKALTLASPVASTSNLVMWLDTVSEKSFNDNEEVNGTSAITTWYDLNPHATTYNNATAVSSPQYVSSAINGMPALRFNGSSNYFTFNGTPLASNSSYTVFVVEQRRASGAQLFIGGGNASANNVLILGYGANTNITIAQYANDYHYTIAGYSSPIPRMHTFLFKSGVGKNYYLNGQVQSPYDAAASPTQGLTSYNNAYLGRYPDASNFFNGDIAEVIMFNKALTNTERSGVESYLSAKWGIN